MTVKLNMTTSKNYDWYKLSGMYWMGFCSDNQQWALEYGS